MKRWLNEAALREMGEYEGRIFSITEEIIRNKFTSQKTLEPIVTFEDGWKLLPNLTQRAAMCQFWGTDSEDWVGQRLCVYMQDIKRIDSKTGLTKVKAEKRVRLPAPVALREVR